VGVPGTDRPVCIGGRTYPSSASLFSSYFKCIKNELLARKPFFDHSVIPTIFFGGGTPSLMPPEMIAELMAFIRQTLPVAPGAEITMECNPGTLDAVKLKAMADSGITRLSLGLQSTCPGELACLGRIHSYEQFLENYTQARRSGFKNINVDLMSALPGQTVDSYRNTLEKVLSLAPEHISAYSLIIEEGTPFARLYQEDGTAQRLSVLPLPSEDDERQMYHLTKRLLKSHGYERYEISNYARPGYECRHNLTYWQRRDYLGTGPGSASLIHHTRFSNTRDLAAYMAIFSEPGMPDTAIHSGISGPFLPDTAMYAGTTDLEYLDTRAEMEEFMFLGLRLTHGISPEDFSRCFGCTLDSVYSDVIRKHLKNGTLIFHEKRLKLTDRGLDVANYVMSDFILES